MAAKEMPLNKNEIFQKKEKNGLDFYFDLFLMI